VNDNEKNILVIIFLTIMNEALTKI